VYKVEEHSQQGVVKDGNHLGGSRGGISKQIRMTSECGPMHPLGCGLNQGQGQSQGQVISAMIDVKRV